MVDRRQVTRGGVRGLRCRRQDREKSREIGGVEIPSFKLRIAILGISIWGYYSTANKIVVD